MIRVLLVTELPLIGEMAASVLNDEPDIEVISCGADPDAALHLVHEADVVLISPRLPDGRALELTKTIAENHGHIKILALGLVESQAWVLEYVEAGADGYIARHHTVEELVRRIRAASRDEAVVSPEIAAALMDRVARYAQLFDDVEAGMQPDADLTPREREVLELIAEGLTNQEIADRLVIEVGTVKNHVHNLLGKLGVDNREDAATFLALMD